MQRLNRTLIIAGILFLGLGLVILAQVTPVLAIGPITSGIAWGPCYYADDTIVAPAMNRDELDFMRQVDQRALTGKRWGPSYAEDTIVAPGTGLNALSGVAWGPSYYADDQLTTAKANEDSLDFMRQVDRQALTGVSEGPSYDQ